MPLTNTIFDLAALRVTIHLRMRWVNVVIATHLRMRAGVANSDPRMREFFYSTRSVQINPGKKKRHCDLLGK